MTVLDIAATMGIEHRRPGRFNTGLNSLTRYSGAAKKRRNTDAWAMDDQYVGSILLQVFPKLQSDLDMLHILPTLRSREIRQATRWMQVIELYFRQGYACKDVAAKLEITTKQAEDIVCRLRRVSRGLRADGKPKTGRKRGRPRQLGNSCVVAASGV